MMPVATAKNKNSHSTVTDSTSISMDINDHGSAAQYALVSFEDFEAADAAIAGLNGQYLAGRPLRLDYALVSSSGSGSSGSGALRHGNAAERLLAAQAKKHRMSAIAS